MIFDFRDPVASESHYLAGCFALFATFLLYRLTRGDRTRQVCVLIYGLSMALLYAASGTFHALQMTPTELIPIQKLDQSAIYVFIAGSCTPLMVILLSGRFRLILLSVTWFLALLGVLFLWLVPQTPISVLVGLYIGMGYVGWVGIYHYFRATGWRSMVWLAAEAGIYTFGGICELCDWPTVIPGVFRAHEVLHVAVIAGTVLHLVYVVRFVLPHRPQR